MRSDTLNPSARSPERIHALQRVRHGTRHLHRLGERALCEFMLELAQELDAQPLVIAKLDGWRRVDPATIGTVADIYCSGRQFPPLLSRVSA
jgi:hypothetical protein